MTTLDILPAVAPAAHVAGPPQGRWTYADYAALPDDGTRYEIIDGVLYMTPAPGTGHQSVSNLVATLLTIHVQFAGLGRVFAAPIDVELAPGTVVQPDGLVVLNANLGSITPSRIVGAPDLVVEIASPSTAGYDRREKQDAYALVGVREYWIVDPGAQTVELLTLPGQAYQVTSQVAPSIPVPVTQFFAA